MSTVAVVPVDAAAAAPAPTALAAPAPAPPPASLTYALEPLTPALIAEMIPLQQQYWQEVAGPFHSFPPDVDWPTYLKLELMGALRVIAVRDAAGALAGGAVLTITPHPHYACIVAALPLLFIHPDHRHGRAGLRLVKLAEAEAEKAGAQLLMTHGGVHNNVARIFDHLDFRDFGRYFVKVLPNGPLGTAPVFKSGSADSASREVGC